MKERTYTDFLQRVRRGLFIGGIIAGIVCVLSLFLMVIFMKSVVYLGEAYLPFLYASMMVLVVTFIAFLLILCAYNKVDCLHENMEMCDALYEDILDTRKDLKALQEEVLRKKE